MKVRWIRVNEQLPDDETEVLVCFPCRSLGVTVAVFRHLEDDGTQKWTSFDGDDLKQPSHWMPLPEPPAQDCSLALTDEELQAIETAVEEAEAHQHQNRAATLRKLLERTK